MPLFGLANIIIIFSKINRVSSSSSFPFFSQQNQLGVKWELLSFSQYFVQVCFLKCLLCSIYEMMKKYGLPGASLQVSLYDCWVIWWFLVYMSGFRLLQCSKKYFSRKFQSWCLLLPSSIWTWLKPLATDTLVSENGMCQI